MECADGDGISGGECRTFAFLCIQIEGIMREAIISNESAQHGEGMSAGLAVCVDVSPDAHQGVRTNLLVAKPLDL